MTIAFSESLGDGHRLPACIAGLNLLTRPIWVFDPVAERKLFANASAVALWGADDLSSLLARDFSAKSDAARIRTETTFSAVKSGRNVSEVWTFYPHGQPVSVDAIASHLALTDGSSAILFEAVLSDTSAEHLRALEAVRHAQTIVSLYDSEGREVFGNPVSAEAYRARNEFSERFADQGDAQAAWRQVTRTGAYRGRVLRQTEAGRTWHDVSLQQTKDPIRGGLAIPPSSMPVCQRSTIVFSSASSSRSTTALSAADSVDASSASRVSKTWSLHSTQPWFRSRSWGSAILEIVVSIQLLSEGVSSLTR